MTMKVLVGLLVFVAFHCCQSEDAALEHWQCPDGSWCAKDLYCDGEPGEYYCYHRLEYVGDGFECYDYDECHRGVDDCHHYAYCTNTQGSFECYCYEGYEGNGKECKDINECLDNPCPADITCMNTDGHFKCLCPEGTYGMQVADRQVICEDEDECRNSPCDPAASCTNTHGSFFCTCVEGYEGDGMYCTDFDECAAGVASCPDLAQCINTPGSFVCDCDSGYAFYEGECTDVDECIGSDDEESEGTGVCDPLAVCNNTAGSYQCICAEGYSGDGQTCTDVDECTDDTDDCDENSDCVNTPGSYTCKCAAGYVGDGYDCKEVSALSGTWIEGPADLEVMGYRMEYMYTESKRSWGGGRFMCAREDAEMLYTTVHEPVLDFIMANMLGVPVSGSWHLWGNVNMVGAATANSCWAMELYPDYVAVKGKCNILQREEKISGYICIRPVGAKAKEVKKEFEALPDEEREEAASLFEQVGFWPNV